MSYITVLFLELCDILYLMLNYAKGNQQEWRNASFADWREFFFYPCLENKVRAPVQILRK